MTSSTVPLLLPPPTPTPTPFPSSSLSSNLQN
jgi:hypothetical protein